MPETRVFIGFLKKLSFFLHFFYEKVLPLLILILTLQHKTIKKQNYEKFRSSKKLEQVVKL